MSGLFGVVLQGMVLAHIDDDEDADPANDGARGYGTVSSQAAVQELAGLGVGALSLSAYGLLDGPCDTTITPEWDAPGQENRAALARQIRQARAAGMRILLSPTLFVADGWRGALGRCVDGRAWTADEWHAFQEGYVAFVGTWAVFAEAQGVDVLSVGLELRSTSAAHPGVLRAAIAEARHRYRGKLTYSANWDEAEAVPFWGELDAIGVNAFFPLVPHPGATADDLRVGARAVARRLGELSGRWDRPVLVTEIGYKAHPDPARRPWEWPESVAAGSVDETAQAMAYDAMLEALHGQPWLAGTFWWKWFTDPADAEQRTFAPQEGPFGFSPRGKVAEGVLRRWYATP